MLSKMCPCYLVGRNYILSLLVAVRLIIGVIELMCAGDGHFLMVTMVSALISGHLISVLNTFSKKKT